MLNEHFAREILETSIALGIGQTYGTAVVLLVLVLVINGLSGGAADAV